MELISEEAVPELGVFLMDLSQHLDEVLLFDFTLRLGLFHPLIIRLLRKPEHPARHRDRHPNRGTWRSHFMDVWVDHFGGVI